MKCTKTMLRKEQRLDEMINLLSLDRLFFEKERMMDMACISITEFPERTFFKKTQIARFLI